jgi:hypothetical protein
MVSDAEFAEMVSGRRLFVAIADVELTALDLTGQHRERADLIRTTRTWLDDKGTIPVGTESEAQEAIGVCRDRAARIGGDVGKLWGRLADVLAALAVIIREGA